MHIYRSDLLDLFSTYGLDMSFFVYPNPILILKAPISIEPFYILIAPIDPFKGTLF